MQNTIARQTNRREGILRAAAELFARQGIAETNLRQIARRAGMSNGTLHYHFPSKDELVETLILGAVEPMGRDAWKIAGKDEHPRRQLERIVELSFDLFDTDWDRYYVALLLGDNIRARLKSEFPTATGAIEEIVRRGQRTGSVRDGDPLMLAILCHGIMLRVPRARAFGELAPPVSQYVEAVVDACWRVLAAQTPDPPSTPSPPVQTM